MEKNNGQTLWPDMTYGFQDHPILISPEESGFLPPYHCGDCDSIWTPCRFRANCTQHHSIAWADITVEQVKKHFPEELLFKSVQGHETGQGDLSWLFDFDEDGNFAGRPPRYDFDYNMLAWGVNGRAAFRIRYEGNKVAWMGFEFDLITRDDIPVILDLCLCAKKCTSLPMYICSNERDSILVPLSDTEGIVSVLNRKIYR